MGKRSTNTAVVNVPGTGTSAWDHRQGMPQYQQNWTAADVYEGGWFGLTEQQQSIVKPPGESNFPGSNLTSFDDHLIPSHLQDSWYAQPGIFGQVTPGSSPQTSLNKDFIHMPKPDRSLHSEDTKKLQSAVLDTWDDTGYGYYGGANKFLPGTTEKSVANIGRLISEDMGQQWGHVSPAPSEVNLSAGWINMDPRDRDEHFVHGMSAAQEEKYNYPSLHGDNPGYFDTFSDAVESWKKEWGADNEHSSGRDFYGYKDKEDYSVEEAQQDVYSGLVGEQFNEPGVGYSEDLQHGGGRKLIDESYRTSAEGALDLFKLNTGIDKMRGNLMTEVFKGYGRDIDTSALDHYASSPEEIIGSKDPDTKELRGGRVSNELSNAQDAADSASIIGLYKDAVETAKREESDEKEDAQVDLKSEFQNIKAQKRTISSQARDTLSAASEGRRMRQGGRLAGGFRNERTASLQSQRKNLVELRRKARKAYEDRLELAEATKISAVDSASTEALANLATEFNTLGTTLDTAGDTFQTASAFRESEKAGNIESLISSVSLGDPGYPWPRTGHYPEVEVDE
jgi:hypothetical protein